MNQKKKKNNLYEHTVSYAKQEERLAESCVGDIHRRTEGKLRQVTPMRTPQPSPVSGRRTLSPSGRASPALHTLAGVSSAVTSLQPLPTAHSSRPRPTPLTGPLSHPPAGSLRPLRPAGWALPLPSGGTLTTAAAR